jgi:hypothetical protein
MSKYEKEFKKVSTMCQVFELSRNKYYEWLQSPVSERKKKDEILQSQIRIIHNKSKLSGASSESGLGWGYHVHSNCRRLALFSNRNRLVFKDGSWLGSQ